MTYVLSDLRQNLLQSVHLKEYYIHIQVHALGPQSLHTPWNLHVKSILANNHKVGYISRHICGAMVNWL